MAGTKLFRSSRHDAQVLLFFAAVHTAFRVQKDLVRITADSGYSDTNHFIKDFKKYTGQTPMQYLRAYNMKSCLTES